MLLNNERNEDKELKTKLNVVNIAPLPRTTKAPDNISVFFRYLIVSLSQYVAQMEQLMSGI